MSQTVWARVTTVTSSSFLRGCCRRRSHQSLGSLLLIILLFIPVKNKCPVSSVIRSLEPIELKPVNADTTTAYDPQVLNTPTTTRVSLGYGIRLLFLRENPSKCCCVAMTYARPETGLEHPEKMVVLPLFASPALGEDSQTTTFTAQPTLCLDR